MLVYDVAEILARKAAKDAQPRPGPQVLLPEVMQEAREAVEQQVEDLHREAEYLGQKHSSLKEALTADLVAQMRELKIDRAKLSNKYMPMIRAEASQAEICAHYERIEGLSGTMQDIYEKMVYVERYGRLPEMGTHLDSLDTANMQALKYRKQRLEDMRCKLRKKLDIGVAKNQERKLPEWRLQLDKVEAEVAVIVDKIRQMRHE